MFGSKLWVKYISDKLQRLTSSSYGTGRAADRPKMARLWVVKPIPGEIDRYNMNLQQTSTAAEQARKTTLLLFPRIKIHESNVKKGQHEAFSKTALNHEH